MRTYLKVSIIIAAALVSLVSCQKDHSWEDWADAEISSYQLKGTWEMVSWNGEKTADLGIVCNLTFNTSESSFSMVQNLDGMTDRTVTGTWRLSYDDDRGVNILSGWYDHDSGFWNHDYIIKDMSKTSMKLIADDESGDVCVYERK